MTTHEWPIAYHDCNGTRVSLRIKGPCRDGAQVECLVCKVVVIYRKPRPAPEIHGQTDGGRTHF